MEDFSMGAWRNGSSHFGILIRKEPVEGTCLERREAARRARHSSVVQVEMQQKNHRWKYWASILCQVLWVLGGRRWERWWWRVRKLRWNKEKLLFKIWGAKLQDGRLFRGFEKGNDTKLILNDTKIGSWRMSRSFLGWVTEEETPGR